MRTLFTMVALLLTAALSYADSGVLLPGQDMRFGNVHVANLAGAAGNVNYFDNGISLILVVHDDAVCAVLKNGPEPQSRRISTLVLGGGYYAQGNVSGAYIAVLGDHALALSLALHGRHKNNGNTIELLGNGNIAGAVRWCFGQGEVMMNKIRFGTGPLFTGSGNDAYICGDKQGTRDLAWANRTKDIAGNGNRTIAWDGLRCETDGTDPATDEVTDMVRDLRPDATG